MKKNSIPRNSFAHRVIRFDGWCRDESIIEIAGVDNCDKKEAERRYDVAIQQQLNRKAGQSRRKIKAEMAFHDARLFALDIALSEGAFLCARDLPRISNKAGWGYSVGFNTTGRAMREIIDPLEKAGLFSELHDEDDKFVGYTLTDAGRREITG